MKTAAGNIRNLIFDFGGVILNVDYYKTIKAFRDLGLADFDQIYSQALQTDLFDKLEKGWIRPEEFYRSIREISHLPLSDQEIEQAWNAIILDMPAHRVQLIEGLSSRYRVFLLSNTNEIHFQCFIPQLKEKFGYDDFNGLFEKAYLSFQVGMKKPDAEIFDLVILENKLAREETLFIDDSLQHIQGAREAGLQTFHLMAGRDISECFDPVTLDVLL